MKTVYSLSSVVLILVAFSCNNGENIVPQKGNVQFGLSTNSKSRSGGRTEATEIPAFVMLSIKDSKGGEVETGKKLPVYAFGQSYISESLQLSTGNYQLTEFVVLDANNKIIYAAPLEGSKLAQYVKDPLPIDFTISKDGSTQVVPQVLAVTFTDTPESFGYVSFGFEVVSPHLISLKATSLYSVYGTRYKYSYKENKLSTVELYDVDTNHWDIPLYGKTVIEYQYNSSGQLVKENWNTNSGLTQPEIVIQYTYNGDKLLRSTTTSYSLNSGWESNYFYDDAGTLKTVLLGWTTATMAYQVDFAYGQNELTQTTYHRKKDGTLGAFFQQVKVGYDNHPIPRVNGWLGDLNEWLSTFRPTVWLDHNITMFEYHDDTQNGYCSASYKYQYNELGYPVRREFVDGNCDSNSYISPFIGYRIVRYYYE